MTRNTQYYRYKLTTIKLEAKAISSFETKDDKKNKQQHNDRCPKQNAEGLLQ